MKRKVLLVLRDYSVLILSAFLFAFGMYYFVFANSFTNGGVAGIVAMINYLIGTDVYGGYINFAINVPLIILSFVCLSRSFALKTTVHIIFVSLFLSIFPVIGEDGMAQYTTQTVVGGIVHNDIGRSILASLYGGVACGIALGMVLLVKGSTGGADIIGAFIQKKNPACSVQWGIFIVNSVIISISVVVYSYNVADKAFVLSSDFLQPAMLAMIFQFISVKVCDILSQGFKTALKFEVVTDTPDELSSEIIEKLKHGVTVVPAKGMFEYKDRSLLICIVNKKQIQVFKDILNKYPGTFAYVAPVNEIIGIFNNKK